MVTLCFVASLILAWYSLRRRRTLRRFGREKTLAFNFWGQTAEFSAVLVGVLACYHALLLLLSSGWEYLSAGKLLRLEHWLVTMQALLDRYKLNWTATLGIMLLLYWLGVMRIVWFERNTPFSIFKKTNRILHVINVLVFLLASFTLLGSDPGAAATTLEIRLQKQRTDYGVFRHEVKRALAGASTTRAFDNVIRAFPSEPGSLAKLVERIDRNADALRKSYKDAKAKYDVRDASTERLLAGYDRKQEEVERVQSVSESDSEASDGDAESPSNVVSDHEIERATTSLHALEEKVSPQFLRFLKRPGAKDIVLHVADLPMDKTLEVLLRPITEAYPVLKPALDVLTSTVTDVLRQPLERRLDVLTPALIEHPGDAESLISQAAKDLADPIPVRIPPEQTKHFQRAVGELQLEAKEFETGITRMDRIARSAESHRNQTLLSSLENSNHNVRLRAAEELSSRGDKLSHEEVHSLVDLMRNGTKKWTTSTERESGHHCTWYEDTSVRYYAGRALQDMKSPYLDESVRTAARRAQDEGRSRYKVTDPGWV
jgi:hypothetical protein